MIDGSHEWPSRESKRDDYRHAHQDVRLGRAAIPQAYPLESSDLDRVRAALEQLGDEELTPVRAERERLRAEIALLHDARNAQVAAASEPKSSLFGRIVKATGDFAERYVMARSQINRAVRGKPSSSEEIRLEIEHVMQGVEPDIARRMAKEIYEAQQQYKRLEEAAKESGAQAWAQPTLASKLAAAQAQVDFHAHRMSDQNPLREPDDGLLEKWIGERDRLEEQFLSGAAAGELEPTATGEVAPMPRQAFTIDEVAADWDAVLGRAPVRQNLPQALYAATSREPSILAKAVGGAFDRAAIQILTDLDIATPEPRVENFTDIWCIFCDRDQLDFIGTNRNESRVEIALTLHAAFSTMIRMSGFSDEVLEASGIDLDDPCLETLANFLNERTNDHYSFGPYETSIDERLFNFLQ